MNPDIVAVLRLWGEMSGQPRGWYQLASSKAFGDFQSDLDGLVHDSASLLALAGPGTEITFTVVPAGAGERLGVDRDEDTYYDFREFLDGSDPADPSSFGPQAGTNTPVGIGCWTLGLVALVTAFGAAMMRNNGRSKANLN